MNVNDDGHDAAFAMNAAVSSATGTLATQQADLRAGVDKDGAYHYARGQRYELLSNTPGIVEPFAPFLVIGLVISGDRKSTRLNSSHVAISYAVFCLKNTKRKKISPSRPDSMRRPTSA